MSLERYVRRDGLISYSVKFFWHGRCYRRGLGPVSLKAAKLAERQARVEAASGTFDAPVPQAPAIPTLAAFAPHFLTLYATDARPRSLEGYASRIDLHLQPLLGHLRLDQITAQVIEAYKAARTRDGVAPRTVNGELTTLSCLLSKAVEWGILPAGAKPKIRWMRTQERSLRVLSASEEDRLLFSATPRLRPLITFALQTGLRRNELLLLTWDDIDWTRREVIVTAERAKSRRRRAVPLNRVALTVLRALQSQPARHGRVFGYHWINQLFHQAVVRAGLEGVNVHTLRHSFATRALERGVAIHVVKAWLGHASLTQTERYAHLTEAYGREMIERLGEEPGHQQRTPSV